MLGPCAAQISCLDLAETQAAIIEGEPPGVLLTLGH